MIKIFVITLDDPDRKLSVSEQLAGLDFEYVPAIKTSLIQSIEVGSFDYEKYRRYDKNFLPDNAVGCSLSHHKLYKRILEENLDGAIILEDDFILNYPSEVLTTVMSELYVNNVELCLLGYSKMTKFEIFNYNLSNPFIARTKLNNEFNVCRRAYTTTSGAVGYYINQASARKIIDVGSPFYVADEWPIMETFNINISHLNPCLVYEKQTFLSAIEAQRSNKNKTKTRTALSVLIDVAKIPGRFLKGRYWKWKKLL